MAASSYKCSMSSTLLNESIGYILFFSMGDGSLISENIKKRKKYFKMIPDFG
ncbi:hypothetical protein ABE073_17085 [Lederbergia citrisecunda]|uniref:hypothetical protein n=1 Tax=Lederbergia citrisecunda TaxID=2833583 RepID=UPI003D28F62F